MAHLLQRAIFVWFLLCAGHCLCFAAEVIPPLPTRYFNDYANVVSPAIAQQFNTRLEAFEKETSSQIVVAIYPKMQSDSSIDDYTVRIAQAWKVGQKDKRNGAVLFVFVEDRKMFLQVGYGLEGAIPDATAKDITEFRIKPFLQRGDYNNGLSAGVEGILQAARGEYKGTGQTVAQNRSRIGNNPGGWIPLIFVFFMLLLIIGAIRRSSRRGRGGRVYRGSGWTWGGGDWGGGGWSSGGGGSWGSSDSGGSFSSGGGDFGGGGAGSSW